MENHKQIHADGTCHAFIGVSTRRENGDQDNKADENQITRRLFYPFYILYSTCLTVVGGIQKESMAHQWHSIRVSSLSHVPC